MFNKVFISYASEDFPFAEQVYSYLSSHSFEVWLDKKSLLPGHNWDFEIKKALREANFIIILVSATSVQKRGYVQTEFKTVLDYCKEKLDDDIYLIPVKISKCDVPLSLLKYQCVNFHDEDALSAVVTSISIQQKRLIEEENKKIDLLQTYPYNTFEIRKNYGIYLTADVLVRYFQFDAAQNEDITELNAIVKGRAYESLVRNRQEFLPFELLKDEDTPLHTRQWSYETILHPTLVTGQLVSYTTNGYTYTGGAHGNYGMTGTSFLLFPIQEICLETVIDYADHSNFLEYASKHCLKKIEEIIREFYAEDFFDGDFQNVIFEGSLDPKWENFNLHYFSKVGVEIIFNPYHVLPYAFGQQVITLPYTSLKEIIQDSKFIDKIIQAVA